MRTGTPVGSNDQPFGHIFGAVAAMLLTEFDHVEMVRRFYPVHKDQFMLGPIKRSHSGIGLVSDAKVQPLAIDRAADCRNVVHVSPVHADEVDGAIAGATRCGTQGIGEEGTELRFGHLAGGLCTEILLPVGQRRPKLVRRIQGNSLISVGRLDSFNFLSC